MVLVRDWSQVRKWARVGSLELLGPTGTGTVKFHCECYRVFGKWIVMHNNRAILGKIKWFFFRIIALL
jgi:hypothetical protein